MSRTKNNKLIFIVTVLYYAGSYIAETLPGGQLILVFAIGLLAIAAFSSYGGIIPVKNTGFITYILVFLAYCAASRIWAEDPALSVNKINGIIFILIGMIVIHLSYLEYTSIEDLLKAIMYGGYVVILYAFIRYGIGGIIRLAANDARITNDLFNANTIGMCAAYSLVINIYFIFYERFKFRDILMFPAVVLLLLSQSRKAILIVALGVIGVSILRNLNKKNFVLSLLKIVGGLFVLVLLFIAISRFAFMKPIMKRLKEILEMLAGTGTRADNSAWLRFAYIDLGIDLFKKNPLLGIGIGNANIYTQLYYNHNHYLHNNYIELLACGGIVGFGIYYSMHLYLLINYFKYRKFRDRVYDICLILLLLNLIVDYGVVSYYDKVNYLFLFLLWKKIKSMQQQHKASKRKVGLLHKGKHRGVVS